MMTLCRGTGRGRGYHEDIAYEGVACPLCKSIAQIVDLKDQLADSDVEVDQLQHIDDCL